MPEQVPSPTLRPVASAFFGLGAWIGVWAVTTADVERDLDLGHAGFGLVLAVALAGSAAANAVAGSLSERWGTKRLLRFGLLTSASSLALLAVAPAPWAIGAAVVLSITFSGAVDVTMNVAAIAALANRPGELVRFHSLFNVGAVVGAGTAGVVLQAGLPWRWALVVPVVIATANWAWVGGVDLPAGEPGEHHGLLYAVRTLRAEHLVGLALVFACGAMVEGGIDTWGVLVLRERLEVGALVGAGGYLVGQGIAAATRAGLGRRAGALGTTRGVAAGGAVAATGLALLALAPTAAAVLGLVLAAVGISVCWPLLLAHANDGRERPGPVVGGVTAVGYTGFVLGPPLVGWLSGAFGLRHALLALATAALVVAIAPAWLRRAPQQLDVQAPR